MRKLAMSVWVVGLCCFIAGPVQAQWIENFDSYAAGNVNGNGPWVDFGGTLTSDVSTGQAKSAPHSLALSLNPVDGTSYGSDVYIVALDGSVVTSGSWMLSYELYVPASFAGSLDMYISQGVMPTDFTRGASLEVLTDGNLVYNEEDPTAVARDRWAEVKLSIDLDADTVTAFYDGTQFHTGAWKVDGAGPPAIGGLNFWVDGNGATGLAGTAYVDDFNLVQIPEPSALVLLGLGGLMVLLRRKS